MYAIGSSSSFYRPVRLVLPAALLALALAASGCIPSAVRKSASFDRAALSAVGVMPSEIDYVPPLRPEISEAERAETEAEIASLVAEAVRNVFTRTPIAPTLVVLTDSALAADSTLRLDLTRVREELNLRLDSIKTATNPISFSLGTGTAQFGELAGTPYLMLARGTAEARGSERVRDSAPIPIPIPIPTGILTIGIPTTSASLAWLSLELTLVDARTGEVVWYNTSGAHLTLRSGPAIERLVETMMFTLAPGRLTTR